MAIRAATLGPTAKEIRRREVARRTIRDVHVRISLAVFRCKWNFGHVDLSETGPITCKAGRNRRDHAS
jgi:hypothetical protein